MNCGVNIHVLTIRVAVKMKVVGRDSAASVTSFAVIGKTDRINQDIFKAAFSSALLVMISSTFTEACVKSITNEFRSDYGCRNCSFRSAPCSSAVDRGDEFDRKFVLGVYLFTDWHAGSPESEKDKAEVNRYWKIVEFMSQNPNVNLAHDKQRCCFIGLVSTA